MINENTYTDYEMNSIKNKKKINKKYIIIILIILLLGIITIILVPSFSETKPKIKGQYTISFNNNTVIYMNEPTKVQIELNGPNEYLNDAITEFSPKNEGIISIEEEEFEGKTSYITINPISIGEDDIDFYTTIGADKYSVLLDNKAMHVIVCETFDNNILNSKKIQINQGKTQKINLNFKNPNCLKNIIYKSENPNIATVDNNGIITAIKKGTTNIKIGNSNKLITLEISVI